MQRATCGIVLVAALAAGVCTGCIAVGGSDHYSKPTLGRQLMDLKTARDTGAISAEEYSVAKSDLLSRRYVENVR